MNVLLINGSPHKKGCTYTALSEVAGQLEKNGIGSPFLYEKRSLRLQARCRRGQLPPWRGQRGF